MPDGGSDDTFPIITFDQPVPVPLAPGTVGVGAIDLSDLGEKLSPHVTDPFVDTVDGQAHRPATAHTTAGPHRYTILVPNQGENSILSLGQADPAGAPRLNDTGLTGASKTHVHFHTTEGPNTTMIALGGPTRHGWAGYKGNQLASNAGFMMVTQNNAWLDAENQFYVVSRTKDVVVRSALKKVKIQADTENVEIGAKTDVTIGANNGVTIIADASATLNDAGYTAAFDASFWQIAGTKAYNAAVTAGDVATAAFGLFGGIKGAVKKGDNGKTGWANTPTWEKPALIMDAANFVSGITQYIHQLTNPSGSATLAGSKYAGMNAGIGAAVYGNVTAGIASAVSTNVLGGTAGLKALTYGGVWAGLVLGLTSLKKAALRAEGDELTLFGKKDVNLTSEIGKVTVTGDKDVQMNSNAGAAFVHGKTAVYAGAGGGAGYGLSASGSELKLGKMSAADKPSAPSPVQDEGLWLNDNGFLVQFKGTKVRVQDAEFKVNGVPKIKLNADSEVSVKAGKILLG